MGIKVTEETRSFTEGWGLQVLRKGLCYITYRWQFYRGGLVRGHGLTTAGPHSLRNSVSEFCFGSVPSASMNCWESSQTEQLSSSPSHTLEACTPGFQRGALGPTTLWVYLLMIWLTHWPSHIVDQLHICTGKLASLSSLPSPASKPFIWTLTGAKFCAKWANLHHYQILTEALWGGEYYDPHSTQEEMGLEKLGSSEGLNPELFVPKVHVLLLTEDTNVCDSKSSKAVPTGCSCNCRSPQTWQTVCTLGGGRQDSSIT